MKKEKVIKKATKETMKRSKFIKRLSKTAINITEFIEDTSKALAIGAVALGTGAYLALEARANLAYIQDKKNSKTDYSKFGGLKHVVYAGFCQLSYLNWHRLMAEYSGKKVRDLSKENRFLKETRPDTYDNFYKPDKYYLYRYNGKEIYHAEDRRSFVLYSEDIVDPLENPKFPEFAEWEFVYAYDHKKIAKTFEKDETKEKNSKRGDARDWDYKTGILSSGFQGSVFKNKKEKVLIIAYRGTDFSHKNDWIFTNFLLGMQVIPDALTCAVWLYEKVATDPNLKDYEIHVTGHSMGGALAQYIACYGLKAIEPKIYIEWDKGLKNLLPLTRPVSKTVTWNGLGIGEKNKFTFNIDKFRHLKIFRENYDECKKSEDKILNFYMQKDLVANIQKGLGMKVVVDVIQNYNLILGGNRANYHGLMTFLPFMEDGNIVREKLSENFLLNSYKQAIYDKRKRKEYAKLRNKNYEGSEEILEKEPEEESEIDYENAEYEDINYKIDSEKFLAEAHDYLLKDFGIPFIKEGLPLGEKIIEASAKENGSGQISNYLHYMMKAYSNPERTDWYEIKGDYAYIGKFNNVGDVAGVQGGVPLKIKLPPKEEKTIEISNFKEALELILPTIKVEKELYLRCNPLILETHKIEYTFINPDSNGKILVEVPKGTYRNNFYDKKSNKYCSFIEKENNIQINLGVTFSYGRDNVISCVNPAVYSPVGGVVESVKFNKIVIKQDAIKKIIYGQEVFVHYYHVFDHLYQVNMVKGQSVKVGAIIGFMGGTNSNGDISAYYQHVHYSIKMLDKDFTGKIDTNDKKCRKVLKNSSTELRYIDPEKFWNDRIEEGITF